MKHYTIYTNKIVKTSREILTKTLSLEKVFEIRKYCHIYIYTKYKYQKTKCIM